MRLKQLLSKRIYLNLPISLAFIFAAAAVFLFAVLYTQPGSFSDTIKCMNESGLWLYFMNLLPILFCAGMIFFLFNNCALAISITGTVFGALSVANYLKIKMRQSPLLPWDLSLGGEVLGIARSFTFALIFMLIMLVIGMIFSICISAVFIRNKPLPAWIRIIGISFLVLPAAIVSNAYAQKELYDSAYIHGDPYNEVDKYNSRGFVYSFLHMQASTKIERPPGYDRQAAANFLAERETDISRLASRQKPHIIVIMSEAFSDISLNPELDFSNYTDPIANFKELWSRSLSGYIVVPHVGGGTADIEFDVLTGINSRHYRGVPYLFSLVNKPVSSLASELARIGYESIMIHPGPGWFYDRANAYPHLGFNRAVFLPDFAGVTNKGMYASETDTINKVISEFESHISSSNAPLFQYTITIQNHGPYVDKYSEDPQPNFETALQLHESRLNALYNYFYGLADADRELKRLTDYFANHSEPVVLLYFGDHLPSLEYDLYHTLLPPGESGTVSSDARLYRTPYIVWQNSVSRQLNELPLKLTESETISSSYLGAALLRAAGFTGLSAYFDYLAEMSDIYPVVAGSRYSDTTEILHSGDEPEALTLLRQLQYYRFFSEH